MRDGNLRPLFQRYLPQFHIQPIEVGALGRGIPDANYCGEGVEGWIEFKSATHDRPPRMEPEQIGWIHERRRFGGRVFIAVRCTGRSERFRKDYFAHKDLPLPDDMLLMFTGGEAPNIKDLNLNSVYLRGITWGEPEKWDWRFIGDILRGPG
jgi:hypothetical protein